MISITSRPALSDLSERTRWVIGIRWTVVAALVVVGLLGSVVRGDSPEASYIHLLLAGIIAAYNIFFALASRRPAPSGAFNSAVSAAQIPLDLLIFTAIVHVSGGVTGPVFVLYFLYIFVGLAILPPAGAYVVAGLAALFYGTLALIEGLWIRAPGAAASVGTSDGTPLVTYLGYFLTVSAMLMIIAYIANYFARLLTRDERTIRQQLDEMNALYGFTRRLSRSVSAEEVMGSLVSAAREMERADACSLILFSQEGLGVVVAQEGWTPEEAARYEQSPLSFGVGNVWALMDEGRGVYAPDVDAVPTLRNSLHRPSTRSFYAVPMVNEDRIMGLLNLSFDRPYTMPAGRRDLMSAMTQHAALALERTRFFTDTQRAAREMTSLYHIGLATTSSLQIDEVLHRIYEQVNRVVRLDTFYIALYDEERNELCYDIFVESGRIVPPFKTRLDTVGITSWVIRTARPVFVRHWSHEIEQLPFEAAVVGQSTQSVISVPLIAKNKIVGVMSVQAIEPDAFDQTHLRLISSIGSQAALALENARLHATVNEQAQRDPLTGAYNHGTLIDKLNDAVQEAQHARENVGLIMLDIDRFKQYNDTYGHLVGDDVLRSTVAAIQGHLKSTDIVGRWGGEEFAVILPGVDREQARGVAERIRTTVASHVMRDLHNRAIPSATVSQGIAIYPQDAVQIEDLIHKADSALYFAKGEGRNRIAEWTEIAPPEPMPIRAGAR